MPPPNRPPPPRPAPNKPLPPLPGMAPRQPMIGAHRGGAMAPQAPRPSAVGVIGSGIESIARLGAASMNPLWMVTMKTGAKFIIKAEERWSQETGAGTLPSIARTGAKRTVQAISGVVAVASPGAEVDVCDDVELNALTTSASCPADLRTLVTSMRGQDKVVVKMKFEPKFLAGTEGHYTVGFKLLSEAERQKNAAIFEMLRNNDKAWSSLGEVVVADILIGNNDRINWQNGSVQNFGNLIFVAGADGRPERALALDAIDPFGNKFVLSRDIEAFEQEAEPFRNIYTDKVRLGVLTQRLFRGIDQHHLTPLGLPRYGGTEEHALLRGMVMGLEKQAAAIKAAGARKWTMDPAAHGLVARARFLGLPI